MKTRLFSVAVLCAALTIASCSGEDGEKGLQGEQGIAGISCWDTNGNGQGDPSEDVNDDGNFDGLDCQGESGADGADGISCWDLNGNGTGDAEEDVNNDGNFDALDCQGEDGTNGNANVRRFNISLEGYSGSAFQVPMPSDVTAEDIDNSAVFVYLERSGAYFLIPGMGPAGTFYIRMSYVADLILVNFVDVPNFLAYGVNEGYFDSLVLIVAEANVVGKNSQASIMSELKAAGVDTSDYNAVAAYFGLE